MKSLSALVFVVCSAEDTTGIYKAVVDEIGFQFMLSCFPPPATSKS